MPITTETLRLQQQLRADLSLILDQTTRDLVTAWATAWDEISGDLNDALVTLIADAEDGHVSRALLLRNRRLQKALAVIADALDDLTNLSRVRITSDVQAVVDQAGRAQAEIVASTLPDEQNMVDLEAWSRVDARAINAIVRRSTEQITADHKPLAPEAYEAVRRELIRGIAGGQNPKATAARMVKRAGGRFNGGLNRAMVIARTETQDAHREAARLGQDQHADVLAGWRWHANLSPRTCRSCISMNGRLFRLDQPGPYDHQCGRCSRAPVSRSWASLGFDVEEPEDVLPSSEEFFTGLTKAEQVDMLGPAGWNAWSAGLWPMDQWTKRQSSEGWRDSYVVASPPR